jgi:hypothetical protein
MVWLRSSQSWRNQGAGQRGGASTPRGSGPPAWASRTVSIRRRRHGRTGQSELKGPTALTGVARDWRSDDLKRPEKVAGVETETTAHLSSNLPPHADVAQLVERKLSKPAAGPRLACLATPEIDGSVGPASHRITRDLDGVEAERQNPFCDIVAPWVIRRRGERCSGARRRGTRDWSTSSEVRS